MGEVATSTATLVASDGSLGDLLAQIPAIIDAFSVGFWVGMAALFALLIGLVRLDVVTKFLNKIDGPKANPLRPALIIVLSGVAAYATAVSSGSDVMGAIMALVGAAFAGPQVAALITELGKLFSSDKGAPE